MSKIVRPEAAVNCMGVEARAFAVVAAEDGRILNSKIKATRYYNERGRKYSITAEMRFDDSCNNGHETFAITADIRENGREYMGGCCHEEIAKRFPELEPLIKWHLVSTDGPMHYPGNVTYMAGERDYNGLLKGEEKPLRNPKGEVFWELVAVNAPGVKISETPTGDKYREAKVLPLFILEKSVKGEKPEVTPALEWRMEMIVGEGKARELASARSCAVWPEATDEELCAPDLKEKLEARLPRLLEEFKAAMIGAGFLWPERKAA